ncbi:MAG: type II toxin-antitoxin system PemK/MazF family toxin [Planctomycetota bacterium]
MTAKRFKPRDILLASYPFTGLSSSKLRPIVVVAIPAERSDDFIALPLTSKPNGVCEVLVRDSDPAFPSSGLRVTSAIKWSKPMTLSSVVAQRRLGELDRSVFADAVGRLLDSLRSSA